MKEKLVRGRLLYRRRTTMKVLDCSLTMVKKLENLGKLKKVRLGARDVYNVADQVHALAEADDEPQRCRLDVIERVDAERAKASSGDPPSEVDDKLRQHEAASSTTPRGGSRRCRRRSINVEEGE